MATKTTKVQKSQPTANKTANIPSDKEIEERLKKIDANIVNLNNLVEAANKAQVKKLSDVDGKIKELLDIVGADLKDAVAIVEKATGPSSELMDASTNISGHKRLLIWFFNQFKVITLETELTYLSRFLSFWEKSGKALLNKLSGRSTLKISELQDTASGFRMADGTSYVSDKTMNDFTSQLFNAISRNPGISASKAIDQFVQDNPAKAQEMGSIITVLKSAVGAAESDSALFTIDDMEDVTLAQLEGRVGLYNAYKTLSQLDNSGATLSDTQEKKITSAINKLKKMVGTGKKGFLTVTLSDGTTNQFRVGSDFDGLRTLFEQNKGSVFDISYVDAQTGLSYSNTEADQASIDRYKAIQKERKAASTRRDMSNFLESIVIYHKPKKKGIDNPEKIFAKEKDALAALFYAAYVNLPKFEQAKYKDLGFDSTVLGSEALPVARMQLARVIERIIAEKVIGNATMTIQSADAVYKRSRQKNISFKGDPEDIINKILFEISPTEFPIDWTLAFAMQQQVNIRIDDKTYRVDSNMGSGFFIDPDLNPNDKAIAQGDHIIAHNRAGATIPRNLLALSSTLNQSKQDAETGRDQILQTVIAYRRLFGSSTEMEWIDEYYKSQNIIGVHQVKEEVSDAKIKAARAKLKFPSDEIKLFNEDKKMFTNMVKTSNTFYQEFDKIYQVYSEEYRKIQKAFDEASSQLGKASRAIRDVIRIALEGKALQKGDYSQIATDIKKECDALMALVAKTSPNRKILIDLRKRYKSISSSIDRLKKEADTNDKDYRNTMLALRGRIDEELDIYEQMIKQTRERALNQLSQMMSVYGQGFQELTVDLKKGQQKFRGARTGSKIQSSQIKVPTKVEDSFLSKNISAYEGLIMEWSSAESEYSKIEGKLKSKNSVYKTLNGLESALASLIDGNQFILFSEFFE